MNNKNILKDQVTEKIKNYTDKEIYKFININRSQCNSRLSHNITTLLYGELNRRKKIKQDKFRKHMKISSIIVFILICVGIIIFGGIKKTSAQEIIPSSVKGILGLENCRTVQKEEDHINKGHMFAMDIACVRGKSFEITAPLFRNRYEVRMVGYDERLGNYVILKHGEYQFIFGHTKSTLKKGDRVNSGDIIGKVNKSGISENYHLHFEIWKNDYNISYKNLLGEEVVYNTEYTYKLRKQRGWYVGEEETMNFIADFEGFRNCAYPDRGQWSIGYGTKSYKGECISKEQAKKRKLNEVSRLMEIVYKNYRVDYHNQRLALVSAMYNLGPNSPITEVVNLKTEKSIKKHFMKFVKSKNPKTGKMEVMGGLKKRRDIEGNKYLNKI